MAFIKKHKVGLIILAIIILLCGGGFYACSKFIQKTTEQTLAMLSSSTEEASLMDITETLSTSGKVIAGDKVNVIIDSAYSGVEILTFDIEEGDTVKEGDVLAVMDKEAIETRLEAAKKSQAASNLSASTSNQTKSNAKKTYDEALKAVDDKIDRAWDTYQTAINNLDAAQRNLDSAMRSLNQTYINGQVKYDGLSHDGSLTEYQTITSAQNSVFDAQSSVESSRVRVEDAQKSVDDALKDYQYLVAQRESDYEKAENNYKSTVNSANASLTSNAANKINSDYQVATYEQQLENGEVKAPISGIVTYVNYKQGDKYGAQPLLIIEDTSSFEIETYVDEYDIPKLKEGQKVSIKSNGTGDAVMDGEITHINTRATVGNQVGGGLAKYSVKISIKNPDKNLRLDMTAKLTITINEKKNVLGVPYNAIQKDDEGKKFIEVMDEAATEEAKANPSKDTIDPTVYNKIYVETGIENDYYVEVISKELTEGAKVKVISGDGAGSLEALMEQMGLMGGM